MPDQTADALERILSLSSATTHASQASQASHCDPAPACGPRDEHAVPGPGACAPEACEGDHGLLSSMFFEVVDELEGDDGEGNGRPRFDSAMSWTADYNDHVLDASGTEGANGSHSDSAPWLAHGPNTYGAPHHDPYGPADKDDDGPAGLPANCDPATPSATWNADWGRGKSFEHSFGSASHKNVHEAHAARSRRCGQYEAGSSAGSHYEAHYGAGHRMDASASRHAARHQEHQHQPAPLSQFIPMWAYETLPRDCLIMLLESALKHMPQEADVVAQCMRTLAPLTREEYQQCFGGLPRDAPAAAGSEPTSSEVASTSAASPQEAVDIPLDKPRPAGWSLAAPLVKEEHDGKGVRVNDERSRSPPAAGYKKSRSPPLAGCSTGEVRRTINKAGARTSIRLTDSRAGTRTSILTEQQAIEVFKLRPLQRTERAALCSELAERYSVTTTAIRHIWDRRTWVWTNIPYWTKAEMAASLTEGTCDTCRQNKVDKIENTCEHCPINRKRGRPRGARDTYRRQRKNP